MIVPIIRLLRGGHAFLVFATPIFTGEDPGRRVELTSIRCGGFNSYFLFGVLIQNSCVLEGVVPAAE